MGRWSVSILALSVFALFVAADPAPPSDDVETTTTLLSDASLEEMELKAAKFLEEVETELSNICRKSVVASWAYGSNITDENLKTMTLAGLERAKIEKGIWEKIIEFPWKQFTNPTLKRRFQLESVLGNGALSPEKQEKYISLISEMSGIYSKAKICSYKNPDKCDLSLEPEITDILDDSRDYDELEHVWKAWREVSGNKIRDMFPEYVQLTNEAAKINGFENGRDYWLRNYESETFVSDIYALFEQIKPFYAELHAYVRRNLRQLYGSKVSEDGALPAHLLGNMWAQRWAHVANFSTPYPEKMTVDVTDALRAKNYTALDFFKESEKFFTSIGLPPMVPSFWEKSIIERQPDVEMICHASAWDFCDRKDFRIKQCTRINMGDLVVVHHEMGHVIYYMLYKDQPITFRNGANSGFHEAVGDLLALSVSTPKHLQKLGLLEKFEEDDQVDLNYLYSQALDKIAFLPFALTVDQFRWDIFSGKVKPEEYNCHWWKLRFQNQGLRPPVTRKSTDFDAGAKYHVPASVPYIRYFVSHILQFQFHKALCIAADEYDPADPLKPLHRCDIHNSKKAGTLLANMLSLGSSKPWPEALEQITGQKTMDASALLEYYKPLYDWLKADNLKHKEHVGWKESDVPLCVAA